MSRLSARSAVRSTVRSAGHARIRFTSGVWFALWILALIPAVPLAIAQVTTESEAPAQVAGEVRSIADAYRGAALDEVWLGSARLELLGDEAVEPIEALLSDDSVPVRLMAAKALLALGETERLEAALLPIAENAAQPVPERCAAMRMLRYLPSAEVDVVLEEILSGDQAYDPALRIAAANSLSRAKRAIGREKLVALLEVDDVAVREAAALVLAELGSSDPRVRRTLLGLKFAPSQEGDRARALLLAEELTREQEKKLEGGAATTPEVNNLLEGMRRQLAERDAEVADLKRKVSRGRGTTPPLIENLLQLIGEFYVDPDSCDQKELLIAAAKGMAASLDPFSSFMDPEDVRDFNQEMTGDYVGIGAELTVDPETKHLLILRPVYKGPAYRAGLRSGDLITEIDRVHLEGMTFEEMVRFLRGKQGSSIHMRVMRRGWQEPHEFALEREQIHIDSVHAARLPGGIGYAAVSRFGATTTKEFIEALAQFEANPPVRGLILDLRDNAGGYLNAAWEMVDLFEVRQGVVLVSQRSERGGDDPNPLLSTEGERLAGKPIVVLINGNSASASEIVAGALQDLKRATLVGERSFGKGSVQQLLPLDSSVNEQLGGEARLRLTVRHYFLPSNRSIHAERDAQGRITKEGGVEPDLAVELEEIPLWRLAAVEALSAAGLIDQYLDAHFTPHKEKFTQLADNGDAWDASQYPEFETFFAPKNTWHAHDEDIRYELRRTLRRRVADERGRDYACDFADDRRLQAAILKLLEKVGADPLSIPEYALLPARLETTAKSANH